MLRHDQNASSVDEAADPSKEKDGRLGMIDRAPRVKLCISSNLIKTNRLGRKGDTYFPHISKVYHSRSDGRCPAAQECRNGPTHSVFFGAVVGVASRTAAKPLIDAHGTYGTFSPEGAGLWW